MSYIAVIVSLLVIRINFVAPKTSESILESMKEGIRFIRRTEGLAPLVVLAFCTTLFGFAVTGFLPVIVQTIFHRGPQTYEMLLISSGAGSICGALMVAAANKLKGQGHVVVMMLLTFGSVTVAFAFSRFLPLSCVLLFIGGAAMMASASLMLSLVQHIVLDTMRGRVLSVYNLAFRAGIPLGSLTLGKLIPVIGVSYALSCMGLTLIAVAVYFLFVMRNAPTFRRITKDVPA